MLRTLIALTFVAACQPSCKKDKDKFAEQSAELEVYQRDVAPMRAALSKTPPSWLDTAPACPAEALPAQFVESGFSLGDCAGSKINECLEECKQSIVAACYSAAIVLQAESPEGDRTLSTPLFARACQLGNASACTNWGSALDAKNPENQDCLLGTFQATCERGRDPWGCTMYSYMLASEGYDDATLSTIRSFEPTACRYGEEDPACQAIRDLLKEASVAETTFQDGGT